MVKTSEVKNMKNWKIITLATLAVVASALLFSTVAAMGPFSYNPNTGYGGMMGQGGMMGGYGYGYGSNSHRTLHNLAQLLQRNITSQFTHSCSEEE